MPKKQTYAASGVNLKQGAQAARIASAAAQSTFTTGSQFGRPVKLPNGFAGALDCGDFLLVMCTDGTGTKMAVAEATQNFATLGKDLLAMVIDDAVCLGAESFALTNTLDAPQMRPELVQQLLASLARACKAQRVAIVGGELAEVGATVNSLVWNATLVGRVAKEKLIDGSKIRPGDVILALREAGLRSNGFSLARKILADKYGPNWFQQEFRGKTWGTLLLTPAQIFSKGILALHGRFGAESKVEVHGVAHITGGGLVENLRRIFPRRSKLGARFFNLWQPPTFVEELKRLGFVSQREARRVWCLGNGMLVVLPAGEAEQAIKILRRYKIAARVAGEITAQTGVVFAA